mmetsp:Transcript_43262/g.136660  ORF Transcript_43262/g.136660 Transcript_43262/m.136660 type:complete len:111 (+) Transcript_43262:388-720(+)
MGMSVVLKVVIQNNRGPHRGIHEPRQSLSQCAWLLHQSVVDPQVTLSQEQQPPGGIAAATAWDAELLPDAAERWTERSITNSTTALRAEHISILASLRRLSTTSSASSAF